MLNKEYSDIHNAIVSIQTSIGIIKDTIDDILRANVRNINVTFKDLDYKFFTPSKKQEAHHLSVKRRKLIKDALLEAIVRSVKKDHTQTIEHWDFILAFTNFTDIKDYQIQKDELIEIVVEEPKDEHGNTIKSRALNEHSHYVKHELMGVGNHRKDKDEE